MKNVLITGCGGFIGSHLAEFLADKGFKVYGTVYSFDGLRNVEQMKQKMTLLKCDISRKKDVESVVKKSQPDYVFHLAAQSFVVPSWKDPEKTFKTNFFGTYYLLDALKEFSPKAKILVACSSAEYGFIDKEGIPLSETSPLRPSSPYAVSKVGQDMLSYLYAKAYDMKVVRLRLFNTTGPKKTFDACSDFARGIVEIEKGKKRELTVGNLNGLRDITDVRDAIRAMYLISQKGVDGDVYNICTGNAYKVSDLLQKLLSMSKVKIKVVKNPDPMRKIDDPIFVGDNTKLSKLGWKPVIPIDKTLSDMLEEWRLSIK